MNEAYDMSESVYLEGVPGGVMVHITPKANGELVGWWLAETIRDLQLTAPKVDEYGGTTGSADLELLGDNIAKLMGWDDATPAMLQELGCWFYLQGKLARLVSDYQQRRPGKPDTLMDATVYAMMMRRLQFAGRWP